MNLFDFFASRQVERVAKEFGAEYVPVENTSRFASAFAIAAHEFCADMRRRQAFRPLVQELLQRARAAGGTRMPSNKAIPLWYDIEYASAVKLRAQYARVTGKQVSESQQNIEFDSHYEFLNLLLVPELFELVCGVPLPEVASLKTLDIGAGNGQLLQFLMQQGTPQASLAGSDVSATSVTLLRRLGFSAYQGSAAELALPANSFDLIFLSYFIDYDINQKATFKAAVTLTRPGGCIVFEGWLPSRRLPSYQWDQDPAAFITVGKNAAEDTRLICMALINNAKEIGKTITIERIIRGSRYVYSNYDISRLPSYFIVARVA